MKLGPGVDIQDLQADTLKSLQALEKLVQQAGGQLHINSGYRSPEEQARLYANRANNPNPVAPPGHSEHQRGTAVDMGVSGLSQQDLANLASQVGFKWAGQRDPVHFSYRGPLTQTNDADTASIQKDIERVRQGRNAKLADQQQLQSILNAGMPPKQAEQQPDADLQAILAAGSGQEAPQPSMWDRVKNYASNLYSSVVHGQTSTGQELNPFERVQAAISPILQGADYLAGGDLGQLTGLWQGGLLTGMGRLYNTVRAPISYGLGQTVKDFTSPEGSPPLSLSGLGKAASEMENVAKQAWQGKQFPGPVESILSADPESRETLEAYPGLKALAQASDFGIDWEAMPYAMKPLAPVFQVAGKAIRLGTDAAANRADIMAGRFQDAGQAGIARGILGANEVFKKMTNATPEFRQAQEYVRQNKQIESTARQLQARYTNTVLNITKKMQAEGKNIEGDFLESHPDPLISEQAGGNKGNLVIQALLHGVEAGDKGSFFNHPQEVLDIAADKYGIPIKPLAQAIEEMKALSEMAGVQMVKHGLLDPDAFSAHAGYYARRLYRTNLNDPMQRDALIQDMMDRGIDTTRANNILISLQQAGESGAEGKVGAGLKQRSNTGGVQSRKLETPEERMEFLPEYNALDSVNNSLISQFRTAAVHGALSNIAGDAGLSAANQIINAGSGRVLDLSNTPRIKGMLQDIELERKAHQDLMTNVLEKEYNARHKWVEDQQNSVGRISQMLAEHQVNEPQKPLAPILPRRDNLPETHGTSTVTREVEPSVRDVGTGAAVYNPDLQSILQQIGGGHREIGKSTGEALPHSQRVKDVLEITRQENVPGSTEPTEATYKKPYIPNIIENLRQAAAKSEYDKATQQWVQDMSDWQQKHQSWENKAGSLQQSLKDAQDELARRQKYFGETDQKVSNWFDKAEQLERRSDLLSGATPTDAHANDALSQIEQKLGFKIADPVERQKWLDIWKDKWGSRAQDIFDSRNLTAPKEPDGVPPELMRHVDQNIIPAVALDDTLSADANTYNALNHPPGWELWEGKGNRDYGAMEGRWGPTVVRHIVEDAIDPSRFIRDSLSYPLLKWVGALAKEFKALHLYYNLPTRAHIMMQGFWDAKASANAAGIAFDPLAYIRGQKEYKAWVEGNGPATKSVQAMLQGSSEIGAGHFGTIYPEELPKIGQEGRLRQFANNSQKKFLEVHQFPKAGLAAVLTDAGMTPSDAGRISDQAFVTRGPASGGIETHGVQQIAEGLNRYGIAIFTSYPLHSINRFFQLMSTNPEVFARYPLIRNYLMQASGTQATLKDQEGEVTPSMIPIPGMKDSRGNPVWMNASNLVPYGGAMRENAFGIGYKSIIDRFQDQQQKMQQMGANPDAISNEAIRQAFFTAAPSEFRQLDTLSRSLNGQTTSPYAVSSPTPLMALSSFVGLPMRYVEDATDRRLGLDRSAIPSRLQFYHLYVQRLQEQKEEPADLSAYLKNRNAAALYQAQGAAKKYLARIFSDKSLDETNAKKQIRHQVDYILSINKGLQDLANMAAEQAEDQEELQ